MRQPSKPKKRKKRGRSGPRRSPRSDALLMSTGTSWPLLECLISKAWQDPENLTQILIARIAPFGGVAAYVFLVDLGCLGVKDGFVRRFKTKWDYEHSLRAVLRQQRKFITAPMALAAKILREAEQYAKGLGFAPSRDAREALRALGPLDIADECAEAIPLGGDDGKPFYIAGPYDDVGHVMRTLKKSCGEGNFHFMAPVMPTDAEAPDFLAALAPAHEMALEAAEEDLEPGQDDE